MCDKRLLRVSALKFTVLANILSAKVSSLTRVHKNLRIRVRLIDMKRPVEDEPVSSI